MAYENISKDGNFYQTSTGDYGFRMVTSSFSQPSGETYRAIQVIADAVVTTTTTVGDALTAESLVAGTTIYGKFDTVSVSSGKVIAYKAA
jgi:hypothetical protein